MIILLPIRTVVARLIWSLSYQRLPQKSEQGSLRIPTDISSLTDGRSAFSCSLASHYELINWDGHRFTESIKVDFDVSVSVTLNDISLILACAFASFELDIHVCSGLQNSLSLSTDLFDRLADVIVINDVDFFFRLLPLRTTINPFVLN